VNIEALILAETGSPRLRPLTEHLPTCLVPVGGTPILDHEIQALHSVGVNHITVIGGYRAAQVEQACRAYGDVRFCVNSRYSRVEPRLSALRAAGAMPARSLLLVRGELVFDGVMVEELVHGEEGNRVVVDAAGEPAGIWWLTARTAAALFAAAGDDGAELDSSEGLYEVLQNVLEQHGHETVAVNGHPWARVESMEDLARALKAHRLVAEARVARHEERLRVDSPLGLPVRPIPPRLPAPPIPPTRSNLPRTVMKPIHP
jgi:hypothetical protein